MLAYYGGDSCRYVLSTLPKEAAQEWDDLPSFSTLDPLIEAFLSGDYTGYVVDLGAILNDAKETAEYFGRLRQSSTAPLIFFAAGLNPDSTIIKSLRAVGIKQFVFGPTLTEMSEQLISSINGKESEDLKPIEHWEQTEPEDESVPRLRSYYPYKTIAYIGSQSRIGTTTQAIQMVKFLQYKGLSACYIEANRSGHIRQIPDFYQISTEDAELSMICCENLDLYFDLSKIKKIYAKGYDAYVFDFGVMDPEALLAFREKEIKVLVGGAKPWEILSLQKAVQALWDDDAYCLFSFSETEDQKQLSLMMKEKSPMTFFSSYTPNPFTLNACDFKVYERIAEGLRIREKQERKEGIFSKLRHGK